MSATLTLTGKGRRVTDGIRAHTHEGTGTHDLQ